MIKIEIIRRILKYLGYLTINYSKKKYRKFENLSFNYSPIFIIGAPRSGTTILYQTITNYLDLLYTDNLTFLTRENPYLGINLSQMIFKDKPHNKFISYYGNTLNQGLHAPNQTPVFLLNHRNIFSSNKIILEKKHEEISIFLKAITNKYQKPFIAKGAEIINNLDAFKKLLPDAKYIIIKRDPFFIAQSLFLSIKDLGDFENIWLKTIKLNKHEKTEQLTIHEKIVYYIHNIYENIVNSPIDADKKIIVDYEEIKNPSLLIEYVRRFIDKRVKYRENIEINSEFNISDNIRISHEDSVKFKKVISKLNWSFL